MLIVRGAPNKDVAHDMRAIVLSGTCTAWEAGPRSAAELKEAAKHYERSGELQAAPALKAHDIESAAECRSQAEAMEAAEAAAKAKEMAVAEAKANAAMEALLAEEEAEKAAAAAASAGKVQGKQGKGKKGQGGRKSCEYGTWSLASKGPLGAGARGLRSGFVCTAG